MVPNVMFVACAVGSVHGPTEPAAVTEMLSMANSSRLPLPVKSFPAQRKYKVPPGCMLRFTKVVDFGLSSQDGVAPLAASEVTFRTEISV